MKLNDSDKKRISDFYELQLTTHGPNSAKSLNWLNLKNQYTRFETLCKIGDMTGQSVLDVGCGLGDLYDYLSQNFKDFNYLGIDLVPDMVKQARIKYPQAKFVVGEAGEIQGQFDYVLASGVLTFNISNSENYYQGTIKTFYRICRKGVAFNMLDRNFYDPDETYFSYEQKEVAKFCQSFAKDYAIVSGYLDGDFTVFLYK